MVSSQNRVKMRYRPSSKVDNFLCGPFGVTIFLLLISSVYSKETLRAPRLLSEPTGTDSVINEKHTKILQCQAIGHPQPVYRWLKDWEPLGNYTTEHFLKMVDISLDDAGDYRCLAKNSAGTVLSPRISLKVAYMNYDEDEFSRGGLGEENSTLVRKVTSGEALILHLPTITSYPPPSVTWHYENSDLLYDIHYVITDPSNSLVILDTGQKDEQTYSARITNTQLGKEIISPGIRVELSEINPEEEIAPSFVIHPNNVTILKGTSISQVQCIVNARPLYQLETLWFKEDIPIERSGIKYFFNGPWNRTLSLLDVSPVHSGVYKCLVRLKSSLDDPLIGILHVTVQSPPFLKKLLPETSEADLGKSLYLDCLATGFPEPNILWFWNGHNVLDLEDSRFKIHLNGTLSISSIYLNSTGTLQCLATNEIGEMSTYTWLKVKRKRTPRESNAEFRARVVREGLRGIRPRISTNPFSSPPVMTRTPENTTAVDGQALVRIPCEASGAPKPNITWFYNDEILEPSAGIEITEEGDLLLKGVRQNTGGKYECLRANEAGQVQGTAWVDVLVKTKIVVPPLDTSVVLGHVAMLHCKYTSAPSVTVQVKWYHDEMEVDSRASQVNIRKDGTLVIEQIRATDAGTYACVIISQGGNDTRSAHLLVMDLPYPPKLVVAEREPSIPKSAKITWTRNFDGNSPIVKFIIFKREVPPTGIEADLGLNWEVALSNISASSKSAIISNLRPSTGYEFKVAAVNNVGEGPPSEPSEILVLPQEAPSGPPQGLVGSPRSNSEIIIQWDPPLEEEVNGILRGYMVRYRLSGYKESQWYYGNVTKETQHNYLITGLITWKDYEIQVAAYNAKGIGVYTPGIRVKTKEGIPLAPPRNVTANVVSSTSVQIQWKPPHPWMVNGINQGYKVQAWKKHPDKSVKPEVGVRVAPSPYPEANESTILEGLEKFTEYYITVLCFTHPGDGKRSDPVFIKTLEDVPDEITNLKFDEMSDRHVRVMWSAPDKQNGILKGYTVSYHKNNTTLYQNTPVVVNLTADVTSLSIDNLTATTYYTFEIYAWTSVGPGKPISSTIQSSVEPVKPEPPTRLAVSNIQPFSVVLQFTPGFDGNASIDLWKVQARVSRSSSWDVVYETSAPLTNTLTVENLVPFTEYSLRLVAVNVAGESEPSLPSPVFQTLQAEPSHPPHNMTLRAMSPTEIGVRWIPLQQHEWYGAPHGYMIKYRPAACGCPFSESFVKSVTANSFQLELLQEFTMYEVKMVAINDVGTSEETPVAMERTRESVPSAGPGNVNATATSSTTILVEWNSVPKLEQNGILEGYKVVYTGRNLKSEEKIIENNATFATTLTHLKKFYQYNIQVKAFTRVGDGETSTPPILVQTLEDVPGPPSDVSFPDVSFTYARIIWDQPQEPNGVITAYDVTYHLTDNHNQNHSIEFGPNERTYRVEDLKPESNYLFLVRARTRLGWGHVLRAPVYTTNNRELPAPPSRPMISTSQITSSSILFTWNPGRDGFAPIRYYSVQYSENGGDWHNVGERIDYSATSHTVTELKPFSSYKFRIQATNDIGASGWSDVSEEARTKPAAPTHFPTDIKVIPITRTSVRVEWTPLFPEAWSGDQKSGGYRIKYRQIAENPTLFNMQVVELSDVTARNIVLDELQKDTNYEIIVTAYNIQGESPPSSPYSVYVGEAVPTGTPRNVRGIAVSATEIKINWEAPEEQERNGELLGCKIFYRKNASPTSSVGKRSSNSQQEEVEVIGPKTTSFDLLYLDTYTEYVITLLCFNPAGEGPRSEPVIVQTKPSLPGPVANISFSDITMNSLKVVWDPPAKPNGRIVGYLVVFETARPDENFSKQVKQKVTTTYLLVQSLKEEVTYKFSVKAETIGIGPEVLANVTTGPQPGSPARPKDVHLSQTLSSVTLHWRNSHPGGGPILGYYIESKKEDSDSWEVLMKSETGPLEEYTVSFQNLRHSTSYSFRLIAYNKFGISYPALADQKIVTPTKVVMEQGYLQQQPFYHTTWFMVSLAAASMVLIIIVVAWFCVKSKTYKYKQEAANKTLEESLGTDDTAFSSYEMTQRGAISKRGTLGRSTLGRRSVGGSTAIISAKTPPRPAPASVTYSDDDTVKGYDEDPDEDSSDVTEKPTDISSTDSQGSDSAGEDNDDGAGAGAKKTDAPNSSFVSHYANVNDTLRQSWRRQKPFKNYSTYTDSEAEGSAVMSLNGGHIIMNNMAGSRAPLPGFSSFV